jgi:small-conductance mechanosensitive channel
MQQIGWLVLAWVAGIAAILGSLMTIATLLLWFIPASPTKSRKTDSSNSHPWAKRFQLTIVAIAIALTGFSLLMLIPFPQG